MQYLPTRLEQYGLGSRTFTETDCHTIADDEGIEIIWSDKKFSFYFSVLGHHCIVLPKRKRGLSLLYAFLHELGHHFLHAGDEITASFLDGHSKDELEADAIALIAMIPKHKIMEVAEEYGHTRRTNRIWQDRCRLFFLYGI